MKKFILILLIAGLAASCGDTSKEKEEVRYTQDSEEINTLKAAIADYEKGDWQAMQKHYADTAKIYHNSTDGKNISDIIKRHEQDLADLSEYGFVDSEDEFEMVLTDDGNTWVNYWGDWKAKLSESDKEVTIPVHLTAQFKNGKIVREHGYWDNAIMTMAMQDMMEQKAKQDSINAASN
ncbi:hypothetical protein GCM10023115_49230 [Pontixanthobacter gangjinensis]|uniref:Nuclear transport factor 2 family protein n=1 Tax=Christiangramia aestuarii TaxID=1028746 RepID=A0A7K1LNW8_9FLAO|nr:nuclear transport factor 2 family protein [Christiangramia aestuarii]MUP42504.1 nuclear transport factor 2 family protein [Christiangramia aestuarii]